MVENSITIETQIRALTTVLNDLRNGKILIPPFQRDFVWQQDNIKDLFDSIKNNYPIGSILLWKPRQSYNDWKKVEEMSGIKLPESSDAPLYILDGCQRLSTLFGCLADPQKAKIENLPLWKEKFELYYDLKDEAFVYTGNRSAKPYQVPLYILTSTSEFRQYSRKTLEPNVSEEEIDLYLDRADLFSRSLIDYKLAVIEVNNAELEQAMEIFSRINSKGTDITFDWQVNALSYKTGFRFADEIDNLLISLEDYNFGNYSRNFIFRCYQSAFDDKLYIDQRDMSELATRTDFKDVVQATTPCIVQAIKFLFKRLHVVDVRLLPYHVQVIFLMTFFAKVKQPDEKQLCMLEEWFWLTTYSNYFTIYSLANQRKAYRHFLRFIEGEEKTPFYVDGAAKPPFKTISFPSKLSLSAVRCKALILFQLHFSCQKNGCVYGNLKYYKIIKEEGNTLANIIPYIGDLHEMPQVCLGQLEVHSDCPYILPAGIFPVVKKQQWDVFLSKRLEILQREEKAFVEKLGLEYTE